MTTLLRILHLEDSPADAELVGHVLRKAGLDATLLRVETRAQFIAQLEEFKPDLILADYKLPEFDGLQALALAREKNPLTPFIFVTGVMGEETAIETLKNGASDYIIKDRLSRLPNAIRQALERHQELVKRTQATHDLLVSETRFRILFESSADAILIQDEHRFIDCNPAALDMFGCATRAELLAQYPILTYMRSPAAGEDPLALLNQHIAMAFRNGSHRFEWTCSPGGGGGFFIVPPRFPLNWGKKKVWITPMPKLPPNKPKKPKKKPCPNF